MTADGDDPASSAGDVRRDREPLDAQEQALLAALDRPQPHVVEAVEDREDAAGAAADEAPLPGLHAAADRPTDPLDPVFQPPGEPPGR